MPTIPTVGSVFCVGAGSSPDKVRLSGPSSSSPVAGNPWYGDAPNLDVNGQPCEGTTYGPTVDVWENATHPGYPAGPVGPGWVPNSSWLVGVPVPAGTYTRVTQEQWKT
jgi:hypothetical protein